MVTSCDLQSPYLTIANFTSQDISLSPAKYVLSLLQLQNIMRFVHELHLSDCGLTLP